MSNGAPLPLQRTFSVTREVVSDVLVDHSSTMYGVGACNSHVDECDVGIGWFCR